MNKQTSTDYGSSHGLYDRVSRPLNGALSGQVGNIKQLVNLIWLVVAVINGQSIALSQMANMLPGETQAESRVTRIREWLKNEKVEVWPLYRALLQQVFSGMNWRGQTLSLIVDGTLVFGNRLQIFRLSLAHGNRAFPLAWKVVAGQGLTQAHVLRPMFAQVAAFLSSYQMRVILLADRGFRDHDWALLCREFGWGYRIRIVRSVHIQLRTGKKVRIDALKPRKGRTLCINHAILTVAHDFATHVSITWSRGDHKSPSELVVVMSDERAHPDRLAEYAVRMDIEQSFRDDKSAGFDIDHTRLQHPERLERLLLAVAIATLWCHQCGQFVLLQEPQLRRIIDPSHERQLSVFQLGLRLIKRALAVALNAIPPFVLHILPLALAPVTLRRRKT